MRRDLEIFRCRVGYTTRLGRGLGDLISLLRDFRRLRPRLRRVGVSMRRSAEIILNVE